MPWRSQMQPTVIEKIVAGLCYFTFGMTGLIYMLVTKGGPSAMSQLFRFHMYQAVFLSIIAVLAQWALIPLLGIFMGIVGAVAPNSVPIIGTGLGFVFDVLQKTFYLLLLYGAVWAFLGKFAEVPFISNVVRQNMRY